jgi:serine/threonine protein kinase
MVLQYTTNEYKEQCEKCGERYIDSTCAAYKWCKPCQMDFLKTNTICSENEKIDNFIEEIRLNIHYYNDILFEWIPYSQFNNIEKIGKGGFATVYLATWKNGPLKYNISKRELTRVSNKKVALKHIHGSQNVIDKFFNEV